MRAMHTIGMHTIGMRAMHMIGMRAMHTNGMRARIKTIWDVLFITYVITANLSMNYNVLSYNANYNAKIKL